MTRLLPAAALLTAALARVAAADEPLAPVRSDAEVARELASITQDPAIAVTGPRIRAVAQALMTEGVKQLRAEHYDQALANFLDAYGKFPSPRILLDIGSTLRDMGRTADAANSYARFLRDPGSGSDRVAEVTALLAKMDAELTLLTVHAPEPGVEISLDGGPWLTVGDTLVARVATGLHLARVRAGERSAELTINGFPGEVKDVTLALPPARQAAPPPPPAKAPPPRVDAWLDTGTRYASGGGNDRRVRTADQTADVDAILPIEDLPLPPTVIPDPQEEIDSGALAMLRVDGKGRGVALGLGVALAVVQSLDVELAVLRSGEWGAYAGARCRIFTGLVRPYIAAGVPVFRYDNDRAAGDPTQLSFGVRAAAGVELRVNGHLSLHGDLGYEHFFGLSGTSFDANLVVPTLAAVGRL